MHERLGLHLSIFTELVHFQVELKLVGSGQERRVNDNKDTCS